jgi:hypothetical protein
LFDDWESGKIVSNGFIAHARAIARETAILSAQHLSRFDTPRRLATLVVFAREMEAILTDAALVMIDKMLGGVFRRADRAYRENVVHRAKALDASARALLHMAKACWRRRSLEKIKSPPSNVRSVGNA